MDFRFVFNHACLVDPEPGQKLAQYTLPVSVTVGKTDGVLSCQKVTKGERQWSLLMGMFLIHSQTQRCASGFTLSLTSMGYVLGYYNSFNSQKWF